MRIHDITMIIHREMPVYKDREDKKPRIRTTRDFSSGDIYESALEIELHTGTHLDAPLHVIEGGMTVESIPLERLITPCRVLDLTAVRDRITREDLVKEGLKKDEFIIMRTINSEDSGFNSQFVYLEKEGAQYLKELNTRGVGIDSLGIERNQPDHSTHRILLEAGILILEGLQLKDVQAGNYVLIALPLHIKEVEASPTRAILVEGCPSMEFDKLL